MTTNDHPQHALVTGASKGIGRAVAKQLLAQGTRVTAIGRDFSAHDNNTIEKVTLDLAQIDALPERLANTAELNQAFDSLILNAGYGRFGGLEQFSHQQIRHLIDTNLVSQLFLLKHYLPAMKARGKGNVVLIGSESALQGGKSGAVYSASKFALRGLAQSLRADCASANIRVILVNPGPVDSQFFDKLDFTPQSGDAFAIQPTAVAETIVHALIQPPNVVLDEINIQPIKRAFKKK